MANVRLAASELGLSPRVRGNLYRHPAGLVCGGSIPTSAGKPSRRRGLRMMPRVYPHECGETTVKDIIESADEGLSPRVRGNHHAHCTDRYRYGSIPTSAGKPVQRGCCFGDCGVYPHECGETNVNDEYAVMDGGLSPRVRGNRTILIPGKARRRSIPTSAGKPVVVDVPALFAMVYPHECGETCTPYNNGCL